MKFPLVVMVEAIHIIQVDRTTGKAAVGARELTEMAQMERTLVELGEVALMEV